MRKINRYLIAPTSQFYYCGVPFRVDTSSKCTYDCQYCFSKLRGGYRSQKSNFLDLQRLNNSLRSKRSGIINELLSFKTPIHFGGMSDPHCNPDVSKITFSTLDILVDNNYPIVISTKNPEPFIYHERILSDCCIIQVSFSTIDSRVSNILEPNAPSPQERILAIEMLVAMGYKVTARIQPFIYSLKDEIIESLIPNLLEIGVDHIILEHLKLPVEKNSQNTLLSQCRKCGLSLDLYDKYGVKYGRSILLPNEIVLNNILQIKKLCESKNVTFGAGDYGFYHFSSTDCCCGVDKYFPESNWFKGNYTNIIKTAKRRQLFISELDSFEYPASRITMYINSHSRIEDNTFKNLLINKWNKPGTANSIDSYYGIKVDKYQDDRGNYVYIKEKYL